MSYDSNNDLKKYNMYDNLNYRLEKSDIECSGGVVKNNDNFTDITQEKKDSINEKIKNLSNNFKKMMDDIGYLMIR